MFKRLFPILLVVSYDAFSFAVSPLSLSLQKSKTARGPAARSGNTWTCTCPLKLTTFASCNARRQRRAAVRINCAPLSLTRLLATDNGTSDSRKGPPSVLLQTKQHDQQQHCWSPQDLTKDSPGFLAIPEDDYIKIYQENPELWPVEIFFIAYRRIQIQNKDEEQQTKMIQKDDHDDETQQQLQILVRKSANGTAKYGLGTGVPVTRWMDSSQEYPPPGYQISEPKIIFDARNFPEFRATTEEEESWTYTKIHIKEDAFNKPDNDNAAATAELIDQDLEEYAKCIRDEVRKKLSKQQEASESDDDVDSFQSKTISVVRNILENANSIAAIQGSLRMSGLFAHKNTGASSPSPSWPRYLNFNEKAVDPAAIAQSMRIYTMFPQMPDPLPSPFTAPEDLRKEIQSRPTRMAASGRDPHKDKYGRYFTHISTSNVSNTIHGVYFTIDVTDLPGLEEVPALDVFGTKKIEKEWISLEDLKVLDSDGESKNISEEDTKPTFISGFIVRQLIKEGVIKVP